jgi:glycosyltransferase involved in cell wall biosynthesis
MPTRSVLILAHSWPPDANVGAVRPVYLSRQLTRHQWRPIVVTVREKYHAATNSGGIAGDDVALVYRTSCIPHPRFLYLWFKERICALLGMTKAAAGQAPPAEDVASNNLVKRRLHRLRRFLLAVLYTPDPFAGWIPFALIASLKVMFRHRPACVISTGPPHSCHLVALVLNRLFRVPWIADLRDPWSWHDWEGSEPFPASKKANRFLESLVVKYADQIVCVTSATTDRYRTIYSELRPDGWSTITNGFDLTEFAALGEIERPTKFTVSYVGSFDFCRTPLPILRALRSLIATGQIDPGAVELRFVGPCEYAGEDSVIEMITQNGLCGVATVVGRVPRPDALRELLRADVLILLSGVQNLSVAAKFYEYLASRRPILALSNGGVVADMIRETGSGIVVASTDIQAIEEAINHFYQRHLKGEDDDRVRELDAVESEYCWDKLGARYARLLDECAMRPRRR